MATIARPLWMVYGRVEIDGRRYALDRVFAQTREDAIAGTNELAEALGVKLEGSSSYVFSPFTGLYEVSDKNGNETTNNCSDDPFRHPGQPFEPYPFCPWQQEEHFGDRERKCPVFVAMDIIHVWPVVANARAFFCHYISVERKTEQIELLHPSKHCNLIKDAKESYLLPLEPVKKPVSFAGPFGNPRKVDDQVGRHRIVRLFRHFLLPFFLGLIGGLIAQAIFS